MAINTEAILAALEQAKAALDQIEMEAGARIKAGPPKPPEEEETEGAPPMGGIHGEME